MIKGKYIVLIVALLHSGVLKAQILQWQWVNGFISGGQGFSNKCIGNDIKVANDGSLYVVGTFTNTINLDGTAYTSKDRSDIFLTKYNSAGVLLWHKVMGGTGYDDGAALVLDSQNNVYVSGSFEDSVDFGGSTLLSNGQADIFIASYDSAGLMLWAAQGGGKNQDRVGMGGNGGGIGGGSGLALAGDSALYITGETSNFMLSSYPDTVIFDTIIGITNSSSMFVTKYDLNGHVRWLKIVENSSGSDVVCDGTGNIYAYGSINNAATLQLRKYGADGNIKWVKQALSLGGPVTSSSIITDNEGSIFLTGTFQNTGVNFDGYTVSSYGDDDAFIAKYDSTGIFQWAKHIGWASFDAAGGIVSDDNGYIYVTGNFNQFGIVGTDTLTGVQGPDIFVACYDKNGNYHSSFQAGGNGYDMGVGIACRGGSIFVTGTVSGSTSSFGSHQFQGNGGWNMFIARADLTMGVKSLSPDNDISIYPNPAGKYLNISSGLQFPMSAALINETGVIVKRMVLLPGINHIQINLPDGLYFLNCVEQKKEGRIKISKKILIIN